MKEFISTLLLVLGIKLIIDADKYKYLSLQHGVYTFIGAFFIVIFINIIFNHRNYKKK